MTQFIGWTTTHKPLNLKDWPLYMTQYIWSYSFAAQSKLMPKIYEAAMTTVFGLADDKFPEWLKPYKKTIIIATANTSGYTCGESLGESRCRSPPHFEIARLKMLH